jgi:glycosyltransferase involved in cell wall biosynthesis
MKSGPGQPVPQLSVIAIVRDVEDTVGRDVRALTRHLRALGLSFEVLAISDGSYDTSLTLLRFLGAEIPELTVLGLARPGRAIRRAVAHAQGDAILMWEVDRGATLPLAVLGWAHSRLSRRRFILARRSPALPILLHVNGRGSDYETRFERHAAALRLDVEVAGKRTRPRRYNPLAPVLRILSV